MFSAGCARCSSTDPMQIVVKALARLGRSWRPWFRDAERPSDLLPLWTCVGCSI